MRSFVCATCGEKFDMEQRGYNNMCVDCTADRQGAFAYLDDHDDDGRYVSGYRIYRDGSYREDFGADR